MAHATEPDLEFHLNEDDGTVWMIKEGDSYRLGTMDHILLFVLVSVSVMSLSACLGGGGGDGVKISPAPSFSPPSPSSRDSMSGGDAL